MFALGAHDDKSNMIDAINYLLSNLGQSNSLNVNAATGEIVSPYTGQIVGYLYKYINVRYAQSADGTVGFSTSPTNATYYGLQNTNDANPSTINTPAKYQWFAASPPFGTTNALWYSVIGGRQILWSVSVTQPNVYYAQSFAGIPIDLDVVTNTSSISQVNCYARIPNNPDPLPNNITTVSQTLPTITQSNSLWNLNTAWYYSDPNPTSTTDSLYISVGTYDLTTDQTVWAPPYVGEFRVISLSQISANAGTLTSGTIGGNMTVNTTGNVTANNYTGNSIVINNNNTLAMTMNIGTDSASWRGIRMQRSRGTTTAPTPVAVNDQIAIYNSGAYTTFNTYQSAGGMSVRYAAAPASATALAPSNVAIFSTSTANTFNSAILDYTGTFTTSGNIVANGIIQTKTYTSTQLNAITGSSGQIATVSNSVPGGKLAYWDTTNLRWSYVSNDSPV